MTDVFDNVKKLEIFGKFLIGTYKSGLFFKELDNLMNIPPLDFIKHDLLEGGSHIIINSIHSCYLISVNFG